MDGVTYTFSVKGSGSGVPVKVHIGGSEYFSCNVDFTTNPGTVSNQLYASTGSSSPSSLLPNVVGMSYEEAISTLRGRGFNNVSTTYTPTTDSSQNGKVISQSPQGSSGSIIGSIGALYPTNTQVTIVIGQVEGVGTSEQTTG